MKNLEAITFSWKRDLTEDMHFTSHRWTLVSWQWYFIQSSCLRRWMTVYVRTWGRISYGSYHKETTYLVWIIEKRRNSKSDTLGHLKFFFAKPASIKCLLCVRHPTCIILFGPSYNTYYLQTRRTFCERELTFCTTSGSSSKNIGWKLLAVIMWFFIIKDKGWPSCPTLCSWLVCCCGWLEHGPSMCSLTGSSALHQWQWPLPVENWSVKTIQCHLSLAWCPSFTHHQ